MALALVEASSSFWKETSALCLMAIALFSAASLTLLTTKRLLFRRLAPRTQNFLVCVTMGVIGGLSAAVIIFFDS